MYVEHDTSTGPVARWRGQSTGPPMLGRLRIGPKLLLAPGLVLVLLIVSSLGAWSAMVRQNDSLETIVQVHAVRINEATSLTADAQSAHARMYQLLTWISGSFSASRVDALGTDIHRRHAAISRSFARMTMHAAPGSGERRFLEQAEAAHEQYVKAILEVIELAQDDPSISANAMIKAERAFDMVALRLSQLSQLQQQLSEAASRRAAADFSLISTVMPVLVALSIVLSLAITMLVRRSLLREVGEIGQAARDLASGNLTVRPRDYGSDEISDTSRALDSSIRSLNLTLKDILASARSVGELAAGAQAGVVQMDGMSDQKSALVEQAAAAAGSLQEQARSLSRAVASLKLDEPVPPLPPASGKGKLRLASKRG